MKTAEELIRERFGYGSWISRDREEVIQIMKDYAKEVGANTLKAAFENVETNIEYDIHYPYVVVDEKSITETEILTP